jgi:hypothetical protein
MSESVGTRNISEFLRETNSDTDGARPSRFAITAMDFKICCWFDMGLGSCLRLRAEGEREF